MAIQILCPDVVNQIAAGEVVERPAHLVKELVENSVDAGATFIHVEVVAGGRSIKVSDNGDGIHAEELGLALKRHATSKISQTLDLWNLTTYGFRGEALASAAAVSRLTLISRRRERPDAFEIRSDFGRLGEIFPSRRSSGTEIKIESLFENVPARLKFLKSDAAEFGQIRNVVKAMALVYPAVEFRLTNGGKLEALYAKKQDHHERVREILGLEKVFENSSARENYQTRAFFGSPHDVQKTSKSIWIFAQNRWIQDRGLQAAVMEAYRSLLMHGEFPQCAVFLKCNPDDIDVNIHPTKSQVKFHDVSLAFRSVQAALREGLERAPWLAQASLTEARYLGVRPSEKGIAEMADSHNFRFRDEELEKTRQNRKDFEARVISGHASVGLFSPEPMAGFLAWEGTEARAAGAVEQIRYWSTFDVLGQANQTYILCQKDQKLILVDQHAAHERVAFEKLMRQWKSAVDGLTKRIDTQIFLFPLAIDLSPEKIEALAPYRDEILRMGIEVEELGPSTIGVKSAPTLLKDSVFPVIFEKLSQDILDHGGSFRLEKVVGDLFATMACHSVVRAGQTLSTPQMRELLNDMDEFPLSSFCPHGRPVSIEMSFNEIEKKFGRIN